MNECETLSMLFRSLTMTIKTVTPDGVLPDGNFCTQSKTYYQAIDRWAVSMVPILAHRQVGVRLIKTVALSAVSHVKENNVI